jgi:hypothetical protein
MRLKTLMRAGQLLAVCVLLWPLSVHALEEFGVYEKWKPKPTLRSDRWRGDEDFGGQEVARTVQGKTLLMRYRVEGFLEDSPSGSHAAVNRLNFANPTSITQIAAGFTIDSLTLTPCAANNAGAATRARPAQILLGRFNDGLGGAGRTGDHFAGIQAFRDGSSQDLEGVLRVIGFLNRCPNADCTNASGIAGSPVELGTVNVGDTFTLQMVWDKPGKQFLFRLNGGAEESLPYTASDSKEAVLPFANINESHTAADCHDAPTVIDSTIRVRKVRTNSSARIP